jgi:hypothetical protein
MTCPDLRNASGQLYYDVGMLVFLSKVLASRALGRENPIASALRESFLIHLRGVIDFLYPRNARNGGILAGHFFDSPEQWNEIRDTHIDEASRNVLIEARNRADKELARLIHKRLASRRPVEASVRRRWDFIYIGNEAKKAIRVFLDNVPKDRLGPKWQLFLERETGYLDSFPGGRAHDLKPT